MMTSLERWLAVLAGERADRVPMDYWATAEATERLMEHLECDGDELYERLHIDRVIAVGPRFVGPEPPAEEDVFGCRYRTVDYGSGSYRECVGHPLAGFDSVAQIERSYTWPSPDWYAYDQIPVLVEAWPQNPIRGGGSEPFLTYKSLRGQERAFMDLIEHPDIVHYCLDRLFDLAYENSRRIYEQVPGRIHISYVAEDLGGQEGLMFSLAHIREFLLPRMAKMVDLAHEAGARAFFHSDGAIADVLPDMVAIGMDVLNPIQWRCQGMDRAGLKRDFGADLVFHGAVDNQYTLPFGTAEEVEREVRDHIEILGQGGGYILAPCHNIQSITPPENVVALYETGRAAG